MASLLQLQIINKECASSSVDDFCRVHRSARQSGRAGVPRRECVSTVAVEIPRFSLDGNRQFGKIMLVLLTYIICQQPLSMLSEVGSQTWRSLLLAAQQVAPSCRFNRHFMKPCTKRQRNTAAHTSSYLSCGLHVELTSLKLARVLSAYPHLVT